MHSTSGARHRGDASPPPRRIAVGGRLLGSALLAATYLPLHRLLDPARTGPAGSATRAGAEAAWQSGLLGTAIVAGLAYVASRAAPTDAAVRAVRALGAGLRRPTPAAFAVGNALLAGTLASVVAIVLFHGLPTSVDEMAQLLHARALSDGALRIPTPGVAAAWSVQNGVTTPAGWASIYPPLHTVLLAAGLSAGAAWLVGPLSVLVATWAATRAFEELLGPTLGRPSALLLSLSSFWLLLGGTHLSHTSAAAGLALVLFCGMRASRGGVAWWLATGLAVGLAVSSRPWVGLVSSAAILGAVLRPAAGGRLLGGRPLRSLAALVAGGAPLALLLLWWNERLFGHPLRLGYSAAFGPAHGLGFHVDPWGNTYGLREALAYTGADLTQLGAHLLQTPLPALALVGLGLLIAGPKRGTGPLLAWAFAAVAANALYWHHGTHFGPRMLFESAPAWVGLIACAVATLTGERAPRPMRAPVAWSVAIAVTGAALLLPAAAKNSATSEADRALSMLPADLPPEPLLVFAHGSWASRIAARLDGAGMRRDSIETLLRRNDICAADRYARWRESGSSTGAPPVDLVPLPGTPSDLDMRALSPGNSVRVAPGAEADATCVLEARSDRAGTIELEPLLWQAPPFPDGRVVLARDLGPARNARVIDAVGRGGPQRRVTALVPGPDGITLLEDYESAMRRLWSPSPDRP